MERLVRLTAEQWRRLAPLLPPQRRTGGRDAKARCLVEHFFQKIKRHRRIAMRFEKLARNFLAFVHLAAILVWLR